MIKKIFSYVVSLSFIFTFIMSSQVYAFSNAYSIQMNYINSTSFSSEYLYKQLIDLGFSDEEILKLYQKEADVIGIDLEVPKSLSDNTNIKRIYTNNHKSINRNYGFYQKSNKRYESYDINFDAIARACGWTGGGTGAAFIIAHVSQKAFLKAIVASSGLGWVSAITSVGGLLFSEISRYHKGATLYITWLYGYDSDMQEDRWYIGDVGYSLW